MYLYLKRCIYNINMETVNNNNDIVVSENHNNTIVPKLKVLSDSGESYLFFHSETTGKKLSKPIDPNYYNDYYNKTKKEITCDICGKTNLKKLIQHTKSNKCRFAHFIQQAELKLKEDAIVQ